MILVQIIFRFPVFITLVKLLLDRQQQQFSEMNFETLYPINETTAEKYVRGTDDLFFKANEQYNFNDAWEYCNNAKAQMYIVSPDQDLKDMFKALTLTETWTGLEINENREVVVEGLSQPPFFSTKYQPEITIDTVTDVQHKVTLKKDGIDKFKYTGVDKTELKEVVCVKNLSYPKGKRAIMSLQEVQKTIVEMFVILKQKVTSFEQKINSVLSTITRYDENDPELVNPDYIIQLGEAHKTHLRQIDARLHAIFEKFKNLDTDLAIPAYLFSINNHLRDIEHLLEMVYDIYLRPKVNLPTSAINQIFANRNTHVSVEIYTKGNDQTYVEFSNLAITTTTVSTSTTTVSTPSTTVSTSTSTSTIPSTTSTSTSTTEKITTLKVTVPILTTIAMETSTVITVKPVNSTDSLLKNVTQSLYNISTELGDKIQNYIRSLSFTKRHSFLDVSLYDLTLTAAVFSLYLMLLIELCVKCIRSRKKRLNKKYQPIPRSESEFRVRRIQADETGSPRFRMEPIVTAPLNIEQRPIVKQTSYNTAVRAKPIRETIVTKICTNCIDRYDRPYPANVPVTLPPANEVRKYEKAMKRYNARIPLYKTDSLLSF